MTRAARLLLLGALFGCGGGAAAPARGFQSRQLMQVRDPTLVVSGFDQRHFFLSADGGEPGAPTQHWSVDVESGTVQSFGADTPPFDVVGTPARYQCNDVVTNNGLSLTIVDAQTGASTTIDGLVWVSADCPTEDHLDLRLWRRDQAGVTKLWIGRYDQLQPAPIDLLVDQIVAEGNETMVVVAALPAQPDAHGIFSVDLGTFAVTTVIPPALAAADADWMPGAHPEGPLDSPSLATLGLTTGVDVVDRVHDIEHAAGTYYVYGRRMADGGTTWFVKMVAPAVSQERALFRPAGGLDDIWAYPAPPPVAPALPVGVGVSLGFHAGWRDRTRLFAWTGDPLPLSVCPLPGNTAVRLSAISSGDGASTAFFSDNYTLPGEPPITGPLLVVGPNGACTTLAERDVAFAGFMPGGETLYWVTAPPTTDGQVWIAAADGSSPRQLATGLFEDPQFVSPTRLELVADGDFDWLDVSEDPAPLHLIAPQVFGDRLRLSTDWLLTGYDRNSQDQTGTLGVVDRATAQRRAISPSVVWYQVKPAADQASHHVLYMVRTRFASPQDGLWLATVSPDDLR